jgi:hypothetical protein
MLHLRWTPQVSRLPGQENQGRVGAPLPPPHDVHNLNCGDISTRDNDDDNDDDGNLHGGREILCAINMGRGSMLCPPVSTTGGLQTQVPAAHCTAHPLPRHGGHCSHHRCPQSCLPLFAWSQCKQGRVWGG